MRPKEHPQPYTDEEKRNLRKIGVTALIAIGAGILVGVAFMLVANLIR